MIKDLVAMVVDLGLGAAALHLGHSLNRTVKTLMSVVEDHSQRLKRLETVPGITSVDRN